MKKKIINIYKSFAKFIKYNKQFFSYVVLSLLCCILLRYYTIGNPTDIKPFLFELACILLIGSFGFFYKPQKQFGYYLGCLLVLDLVCIINSVYYDFYSSFASFSLITCLGQVGEVGGAVFAKFNIWQFSYLLSPIIFTFIHKHLKNRDYFNFVAKFEKSKQLFLKILISGALILIACTVTLSSTAISRLAKQWNREYIVNRFGIIVYQMNDLVNTLRPTISSWFGYDVALKEFNDYYTTNTREQSTNKYTNKYEGYNVIFVHMESMTTFLLNLKVNGVEITPNLTKLTKEGMYFSNFYPQIGVGTSSDTEFTLNTSLMPASNGTVFVSYYDRDYVSIPKLLKEKGYYTFSMHGNKASMWNRDKMHPSLGYMDFYSKTSFNIDEIVGLGLSDKSFFKQAMPILENIESNNKNYMGTIITLSNHTPFDNSTYFDQIDLTYKTTKKNTTTGKDEDVTYPYLDGTKLGDYIRSAHYADQALGDFITMVKNSNAFNKTIFVFYGDHDPKLAKSEFYNYYNFNPETGGVYTENDANYVNYDYYANELNKKTPLIIWSKNEKISKKVDYYMGMIDVMPTVGNMLGIYNKYALGHDIFQIKNDNIIAFPNGNFLTNRVYYYSSEEEYKALNLNDTLSEDYINSCKAYTEKLISVSNDIIVHDLIKNSNEKVENK
jgi:lipoteichoic acid synthase